MFRHTGKQRTAAGLHVFVMNASKPQKYSSVSRLGFAQLEPKEAAKHVTSVKGNNNNNKDSLKGYKSG